MKKEMLEMKQMIMSIAQHLGGVRTDMEKETKSQQSQSQQHQQQSSQSQHAEQQHQQSTLQTALANYTGADEAMSDGENSITSNDSEDARKKQKQTHTKIFDLPGVTNQRADSPQLLQDAVDTFLDGSTDILSPTEEERASMYD
jgi:hypothetical protein